MALIRSGSAFSPRSARAQSISRASVNIGKFLNCSFATGCREGLLEASLDAKCYESDAGFIRQLLNDLYTAWIFHGFRLYVFFDA